MSAIVDDNNIETIAIFIVNDYHAPLKTDGLFTRRASYLNCPFSSILKTLTVIKICRAFLNRIKPLDCGIYASYSWLTNYIDWRSLGCAVWNAQRGRSDDFKGYIWQFTDNLKIGGKFFDGNILYD